MFVSKKQNAWAHTAAGTKALGGKDKVKEWEADTDYKNLPEKKSDATPKPKPRMRHTRQSIPR